MKGTWPSSSTTARLTTPSTTTERQILVHAPASPPNSSAPTVIFYDFIIIVTNFDFPRGDADAIYTGVRNDVQGIGVPIFDAGDLFGSPSRLQGVVDMGSISHYRQGPFSVAPADPRFRSTLGIVAHEIGHRWLARPRFKDVSGTVRTDLLGRDGNHWSFLLDSDASFLYGNRWQDNGDGTFTSVEVQTRYSSLDLYLMGLAHPEEVPPFTLLINSEVDPTQFPDLGARIEASTETIQIGQVIEAEGARSPDVAQAPKNFNLAFVFLTQEDIIPSAEDLAQVEAIRSAFVTTFFSLTLGRGYVDTDLLNVTPPEPSITPDTLLALDWLLGEQETDGRWEDHPLTDIRDTSVVLRALDLLGVRGEESAAGLGWLTGRQPITVDFLSRTILAGVAHDPVLLLSQQNLDGGWGIANAYRSEPLDTALALLALTRLTNAAAPAPERLIAAEFLLSSQRPEGSWSAIAGQDGDLVTTCQVIEALQSVKGEFVDLDIIAAVQLTLSWLVGRQQPDGGFGDGPSTPYATARAVETLLDGGGPIPVIDLALDYLRQTQESNGSWTGSSFQTASVLAALVPASVPNLAVDGSDITLTPDPPEVGELVTVQVTVRNRSRVAAGSFSIHLFDGDPEAGGQAIGDPVDVSGLLAGASTTAQFSWDTSGLDGLHTLFAVADLASALVEVSKTDNVASRVVDVLPPLPNLVAESLLVSPDRPIEGSEVTLTARVANAGSEVATSAFIVKFHDGAPELGLVLDEVVVTEDIAPGGLADVEGRWDTTGALGVHDLFVVVDALDDVRERVETDNRLSRRVEVRVAPPVEPDFELTAADLTLVPPRLEGLPQDVTLSARIRNTGSTPVDNVLVELFQGNPTSGGLKLDESRVSFSGDTETGVSFGFSITGSGTKTFFVLVDGEEAVAERDESNNVASVTLVDLEDTIEVELIASSLTLSQDSITAGDTLLVEVDAANRGTRSLAAVTVALFFEDENPEDLVLASNVSLSLAAGETRRAQLSWAANRVGTIPLLVRADPFDVLAELDETNNEALATVDVVTSDQPNLTVQSTDIAIAPDPLLEGQPASLTATIRNVGTVNASAFTFGFFAGDPEDGGLPIGQVEVPILAADEEVAVDFDWDDVTIRGQQLLFAVADVGGVIGEFDEGDNAAFKSIKVIGLPDLFSSSAQIRLDPPFARSGEVIAVEASLTNVGEQDADAFTVEIRLDDAQAGPVLGSQSVSGLAPGESFSFSVDWDTAGVEGEHELLLVLDVADLVREQSEGNNVIRFPLALQDADVFVTPIYFSPNGDGVQDEAAFFFDVIDVVDVGGQGPFSVEVVDSQSAVVQGLGDDASASDSVIWDGRDAEGRIARDGIYFFVLSSAGGEILRRRVVLDTNRSSIVEALGTPFASFVNLTCPLPGSNRLSEPAWLPDDSAAYFIVAAEDSQVPEFPLGLYRVSADGTEIEAVKTGSEFRFASFEGRRADGFVQPVSPAGRRALISVGSTAQVVDLSTGELTPLGTGSANARWSPDGQRILRAGFDGLSLYTPEGEFVVQLTDEEAVFFAEWSPDGRRIVYNIEGETFVRIMDADGSNNRELPETDRVLLTGTFGVDVELDFLSFSGDSQRIYVDWDADEAGTGDVFFEFNLVTGELRRNPDIGDRRDSEYNWTFDGRSFVRRLDGREARPILASGSNLRWSPRSTQITFEAFEGTSPAECNERDIWSISSLLNGAASLRLARLPSGFGVRVRGSAADLNLANYTLEFAPLSAPDAFTPIQPPSIFPVADDVLTTWLPPAPGDYLVRLTVRDLAGNETVRLERIFWEETLPIADLTRSPEYISPNGDGIQDETVFNYTVLEPVNLEFLVRNEQGVLVRTILRDEASIGPASFAFDGTDDSGARLPDGMYTVELRGAEFRVVIDATPPDVEAVYTNLYTGKEGLAVDLVGHILDPNLHEWSLQDVGGNVMAASLREVGREEGRDVIIIEALAPQQGLELEASDFAGNVTFVPLSGPDREVRVIQQEAEVVGPLKPGPPDTPRQLVIPPGDHVFWRAEASFDAGSILFRFRRVGDPSFTERATEAGDFSLDANELELGQPYEGHFVADGIQSEDVSFVVGPDAIFVFATLQDPTTLVVSAFSTVEEELVKATLIVRVNGIGGPFKVYEPFPGDVTELVPVDLACGGTASASVVATGASGKEYLSTTTTAYPDAALASDKLEACVDIRALDSLIQQQVSCDSALPVDALIDVRALSFPSTATNVSLVAQSDTLPSQEVARQSLPGLQGAFSIGVSWNLTGLAEGSYTVEPVVNDSFRGSSLEFYLDNSRPEAIFESPPEGGNACVRVIDDEEFIEIEVVGRDREVEFLSVERLVSADPDNWQRVERVEFSAPVSEARQTVLVPIPIAFEGELTLRLVVESPRLQEEVAEKPVRNSPSRLNNGSILGCAVRRVLVSRTESLGPLASDPASPSSVLPPAFSPNADAVLDELRIQTEVFEPVAVDARVVTSETQVLVRQLLTDANVAPGTLELLWDGTDDATEVVADGRYTVIVDALSGCGALTTRTLDVDVDTSPPTVRIDSPADGQPVTTLVEIRGTAADERFVQYVLEFGEGASPAEFFPIGEPSEKPVEDDALGLWEAGVLVGEHTVRLTAADRAGNVASTEVTVDVQTPDLIERFSVAPVLFSPDADGVKDTAEFRFTLKADSRVTLEIRKTDSTVLTTLIVDELRPTGDHVFEWDGQTPGGLAEDGDYVAVLIAVDAQFPTLTEEATLPVVVDVTDPVVTLTSSSPGAFVSVPHNLTGTILEEHFEGYRVELGPEPGELAVIEDAVLPPAIVLARFDEASDGLHRLRIKASDRAGNTTEVSFTFTVDSTSPQVSINAPEAGAFLKKEDSISVSSTVAETNLDTFLLEFGLGAPPEVFVPLAGGSELEQRDFLTDWEVSEFPDGLYTLRLSAIDLAGNRSETSRVVTLDGTPPVLAIDVPAEGTFVSEIQPVLGTATDDHLEIWTLAVAPGGEAQAFQFTELSRATIPVESAQLHEGFTLQDGTYTLRLLASDIAGNKSTLLRTIEVDTDPPAAPINLTATVENQDDVRLDWQAPPDPDIEGYLVFRKEELLTAEPISATELRDLDLPDGFFVYTVRAVDRAGLQSDPSNPAEAVIDITPPHVVLQQPENESSVRGLVDIVGTAFSADDFEEYRLTVTPAETPLDATLLASSSVPVNFATLLQWNTILLDGSFTVRLEAEDEVGNLASDEVLVTIDNQTPGTPTLLSVEALAPPDDVEVVWEALAEPVAGYLVFRNGSIANAPGSVAGDLGAFLIDGTSYVDPDMPDGEFCYRVAAMDEAGNLGPDSNEVCIVLDNRPPSALIFDPQDGARFDQPRQVRAITEDEDVATVLFQYQLQINDDPPTDQWMNIETDSEAPFEVLWDITSLDFGSYFLRAVATDFGSRSDDAPATIRVTLGDATPPAAPENLVTRVTGDDVALTWAPVSDPNLEAYQLYRDDTLVAAIDASLTTADDLDLGDGLYGYEVTALDADGNESDRSDSETARVYAPLPILPFPIFIDTVDVAGENAEPDSLVRLNSVGSPDVIAETTADGEGAFSFGGLSLPLGENLVEVRATDPEGNESRASESFQLIHHRPPDPPAALSGEAQETTATLNWTPNIETDISGYLIDRDGEPVTPTGSIRPDGDIPTTLTATADSNASIAGRIIDGSPFSLWLSSFQNPFVSAAVEIGLVPERHLNKIAVNWTQSPRDYRILAEISGQMLVVADARANTQLESTHSFPLAFKTPRIRIEITALQSEAGRAVIGEVELTGLEPISDTAFTDTLPRPGTYNYTVSALDIFGGASIPSGPIELVVAGTAPPSVPQNLMVIPVPEGEALDLTWDASTGPVAGYVVLRALTSGGPYQEIARVPETAFHDEGLQNGTEYFYVVRSFNDFGNESLDPDEASGIPQDVAPPAPPLLLHPATPERPATVFSGLADIVGAAEPGSLVTVKHDGEDVGSVVAELETTEQRTIAMDAINGFTLSPTEPFLAIDLFDKLELHHLGSGEVQTLPGGNGLSAPAFSPDGESLALTQFNTESSQTELRVIDLATGAVEVVDAGGDAFGPIWISGTEIAVRVGNEIRVVDRTTGTLSTLYTSPAQFVLPSVFRLSPDASLLAFAESVRTLRYVPVTGGDAVTISTALDFVIDYAWTSDNNVVYFDDESLFLFNTTSETGAPFFDLGRTPRPALALSPEGRVSFLTSEGDDYSLFLRDVDGAIHDVGLVESRGFLSTSRWTNDLRLVVSWSATPDVLFIHTPPGRFELLGVSLNVGENAFTGTARDAFGNLSDESAPALVTFDRSRLPDLTPEGDILVVPGVPTTGQSASLSVNVRNDGATEVESALVQATGRDLAENVYLIGNATTPAIEPGESVAVHIGWDTTDRLGSQEVTIAVDPLQAIEELDEQNNAVATEVTVVGTAGVELTIATGLPSYGVGQDVQVTVQAINGGPDQNVMLETLIEDAGGQPVAGVDVRSTFLSYADTESYSVFWNTGTTLAGDYRARVNALEGDRLLATVATDFSLIRSFFLETGVTTGRPSYREGEAVDLLGTVTNTVSNVAFENVTARFRVLDGASAVLFEESQTLPQLAREVPVSLSTMWTDSTLAPGVYTIGLDVFEGAELLGAATSTVEIVAVDGALLTGSLELDESAVPLGAESLARWAVDNSSPVDLLGGVIRFELLDPATGDRTLADELTADIAAGDELSGEIALSTVGLPLGAHEVLLSAGLPGSLEPLASDSLTLFAIPSPPSLNAPGEGESAPQPLELSVNNASNPNGEALTYTFEIYLDPALQVRVAAASGIPEGTNTTMWPVPITLAENQMYHWRARAEDRFTMSDFMSPASFFIDSLNEAPGAPGLSAPAEGSEVSELQPNLEITNAVDPEDDILTYTFEIYTDVDLTELVTSIDSVTSGGSGTGTTFVQVPQPLDEDQTYFWRSRANDGELDGEWMTRASFRINTGNQAPTAPTPLSPIGTSPTVSPDLVIGPSNDPEGDPLTYTFEIDTTDRFDSPAVRRAEGVFPSGPSGPSGPDVDPDLDKVRWPVPEALAENVVYFWRARATDGLAVGDWSDIVSFRVDEANQGPSSPTPQSPTDGVIVETVTPPLAAMNSTDPEDDTLTYDFEVYSDEALTERVAVVDRIREGEDQTRWAVSPQLENGRSYFWRCRANDDETASDWSLAEPFRVNTMNETPTAPSIDSPPDGGRVADPQPILTVVNATDPNGDPLTYRFELYRDELLADLVVASPEIVEEPDKTSWQIPVPLDENVVYYWRARANDGVFDGPFTPTASFRVSAINENPASPTSVSPADGAEVNIAAPVLEVENAGDPDGDVLRYIFQIFSDVDRNSLVIESPEIDEGDPRTTWQVTEDLNENGVFYWHAIATDGLLQSDPSDLFRFRINAVRDEPTAPRPIAPANESEVASTAVRLEVENATSPDLLALHYHFQIATDPAFQDLIAQDENVENVTEGDDTTGWDVPVELTPDVTYYWRARAIDELGLPGPWSDTFQFTVVLIGGVCPPEWREDFEGFLLGSTPADWWLRIDKDKDDDSSSDDSSSDDSSSDDDSSDADSSDDDSSDNGHRREGVLFAVDRGAESQVLQSRRPGEGALLFVGSGEALTWQNYAFGGDLTLAHLGNLGGTDKKKKSCFGAGVAFYADPEAQTEYRFEITGCNNPRARLVKFKKGKASTLTSTSVERPDMPDMPDMDGQFFEFEIETVHQSGETSIRAHLRLVDAERTVLNEWWLDAVDSHHPFVGGTIGAFVDHSRAAWDNFHVGELSGHDSGISGDENGDGVCDVEETCPDVSQFCLDDGFHKKTGLSKWIVARHGHVGHSGPGACGAKHSYWVKKNDGVLVVQTPFLEAGMYEFQLLLQRGTNGSNQPNLRVVFENGQEFDFADPVNGQGPFEWTVPVRVVLDAGVRSFGIVSIGNPKVHVEGFRLQQVCE